MAETDMYALAKEYLDACVAALNTTVTGAPERAFISSGVPAWDCCEQLSVHAGGPSVAPTADGGGLGDGHRIATLQMLNSLAMTATIIRVAPSIGEDNEPPSQDDLNATSMVTYADVWSMWNYVVSAHRAGALFAPAEREVWIDGAVSINAQGGLCGWQLTVRVQLSGYKAYVPPGP